MQMFPCDSQRIAAYGFEPAPKQSEAKGTGILAIEFHDGSTWHYAGVPESVFENFLMADSKGSFFARFIQPQYPGEKSLDSETAD